MKVLLLKNYPSATPADHATVQSFTGNIQGSVQAAQLDICCIANGETIPDTSKYDLVILSGGRVNLLEAAKPSWVLDVLDMIRRVAGDDSKTRLLGICWGHQAIHYALGGKIAWLDAGPKVGIQKIELTPEGQEFFQQDTLMLHKYHVRYVSDLAPGFRPLAKENEITISSRKILTFQGHPEMTNEISRLLVEGDDGTYKQRRDIQSLPDGALMLDVSTLHDGSKAWKDILRWAHP